MNLGNSWPRRRSAHVRRLTVLSGVVLLAAGCGVSASSPQPADGPGASTASGPRFTLERAAARRLAVAAVRRVPVLDGPVTVCPGGPSCHRVPAARWTVSASRAGAPIGAGNGLSTSAYVAVAAFDTPAAARRFVVRIRGQHQRYDGVFHVPVTEGSGNRYAPGEDGTGTLRTLERDQWSGWRLQMLRTYTFDDGSASAGSYTRRTLVSRDRYVCALYVDARTTVELSRLGRIWPSLMAQLSR